MLWLSLFDYCDAVILVKGTITVVPATAAAPNNVNKKVIFKNCASFTNCISRINNMQVDDAHDIAVVTRMYQSIEYIDSYSKTSGILWQYCRDEATLNDDDATDGLTAANTITDSLKIKEKVRF